MTTLEEAVLFLLESHAGGNWDAKKAGRLEAIIRDPYLKSATAQISNHRGTDGFGSTDETTTD